MKKIIFKFWVINLLISILLFIIYRILIEETEMIYGNFLEMLVHILEQILNIFFASIYLIMIILSSFTMFLNLTEKTRNNLYLSLLTFLGIPSFCVILIIIKLLIDIYFYDITILTTLALFSIIYLFITTIEFILFRKIINKRQVE